METVCSGNAAVTFSRNPTRTFSLGRSPAPAPFANTLVSPNLRLSANGSFASPVLKKWGKKAFAGSHVPFAQQTVITPQTHGLIET